MLAKLPPRSVYTFAAVDIGSNSVRLKIAGLKQRRLSVIHEDREVTRLGHSVFTTGQLSPAAMAGTIEVLQRFHKAVQECGTNQVRVVATSAIRDARNGRAFIDWVRQATGWRVNVISGLEEARLIHLAIVSNYRLGPAPVLMLDLGGGSCEFTISSGRHIAHSATLPLGAVRLTEEFLRHDPPREEEMLRLSSYIDKELDRVVQRLAGFKIKRVIATSGTAASLARFCHLSGRSQKEMVVEAAALAKVSRKLARLPMNQRRRLPGIGPRRAEIVIAGATVFAQLMERCNLRQFHYSPLGLRDGLLAEMSAATDRESKSYRQLALDREDALRSLAKQYALDYKHAQQVCVLALDIFRQLRPVHELPPAYAAWIQAAALLHEVGLYVGRYGWHRHTHYIIAHTEFLGYSAHERSLIAAIARYLGNSLPSVSDKAMKTVQGEDLRWVSRAIAVLRLAKALDQSRRGAVAKIVVGRRKEGLRLTVTPRRGSNVELEMWALRREQAYFRKLFGRELEVAVR